MNKPMHEVAIEALTRTIPEVQGVDFHILVYSIENDHYVAEIIDFAWFASASTVKDAIDKVMELAPQNYIWWKENGEQPIKWRKELWLRFEELSSGGITLNNQIGEVK